MVSKDDFANLTRLQIDALLDSTGAKWGSRKGNVPTPHEAAWRNMTGNKNV